MNADDSVFELESGLYEIDMGDFSVTEWEADFLNSFIGNPDGDAWWTLPRREAAKKMIDRYLE